MVICDVMPGFRSWLQDHIITLLDELDLSVVLTTRNRMGLLQRTLASLAAQRVDNLRWEVVVIDNGSTDDTADMLKAAAAEMPIRYGYLEAPGKTRAQNHALSLARGTLVVFSDDDVHFNSDWLMNLWRAACRWPEADLFGGAIDLQLSDQLPAWLDSHEGREIIKRACAHYEPRPDEGYTDVAPIGPNMAVRKKVLDGIQFDENIGPDGTHTYIKGGDTDLNQYLMGYGYRCVFVPEARVYHSVRDEQLSLTSFFQGNFRRGRKNAYLYAKPARLRVAGAPINLWLRCARSGFRYVAALRKGHKQHYLTGARFHYRRGYLYQYRLQRLRRRH